MYFEGRRRPRTGPNLTPLVDVVFLLLLFFMLTSHFVQDEVVELDLPEAESGAFKDEVLQVVLREDGKIFLDQQPVELADLRDGLTRELAGRSEKTVRIRGDKNISLELTVEVLDAARLAGAEGVDLVTRQP